MNSVHILAPYFFSTIFPSTSTFPKWSLSIGFSDYNFIYISSPPRPRNDPWYDRSHIYTDSTKPSTESENTENVCFKAILWTTNTCMLPRQIKTYDATGVPVCSFRERSADNMEYCFQFTLPELVAFRLIQHIERLWILSYVCFGIK